MHEFHLHAHTWADNRTGWLSAPDDETRVIDAKSVGPSESWGFQVVAGDQSGPGDWMLHCHIQEHSDRGMVTFFRVLPATGVPVVQGAPVSPAHGGH
jgi:FtsP/CotA-like multicopper oxidase with cupredoxin domain